jgi:DNA-damage-inducible protein D
MENCGNAGWKSVLYLAIFSPDGEGKMETGNLDITSKLDALRRIHSNGSEYWMARDIQPVLGYSRWENLKAVIEKGKAACESTGMEITDHFLDATKVVPSGSGAEIGSEDCFLSRYACYLIAMNGDSRKPEIGLAQSYFAVQTRRQERSDELTEAKRRIELRARVTDHNKRLNSAAKEAGVASKHFGVFHDAGYRGLYEMSLADIKRKKSIPGKDSLLDYAGRVELAANDFRITQTEQKLRRDRIQGRESATRTHQEVGSEVRATIKKLGGTMPENLPPEAPIRKLKASGKKPKSLKN